MKKIVLTGPESTGKSWLSGLLAGYFQTTWVPEYLREYFEPNRAFQKEEMEIVAKRQIEIENNAFQNNFKVIFLDTNIISLKIYYEHYFHEIPEWFHKLYKPASYDHYLLLDTSIPWIEDAQRDSPEIRELLYQKFERELRQLSVDFTVVSGNYSERLQQAKSIVSKIIQ